MNYKLIFPTYRTRWLFLKDILAQCQHTERLLHIGTGEGDYDRMLANFAESVVACDINEIELAFASELNRDVENLEYQVQDAQSMSYEDESFDLVVAIDVVEHVLDSEAMIREISRVLKPGGLGVISFPSVNFPLTYDPINRLLALFGTHVPIGAYGFGHFKLIDPTLFETWTTEHALQIVDHKNLTGSLAAIVEMYWPGIMQSLLKANAKNQNQAKSKRYKLRPSAADPPFLFLTDLLIKLDRLCFQHSTWNVGVGYLLKKPG